MIFRVKPRLQPKAGFVIILPNYTYYEIVIQIFSFLSTAFNRLNKAAKATREPLT